MFADDTDFEDKSHFLDHTQRVHVVFTHKDVTCIFLII